MRKPRIRSSYDRLNGLQYEALGIRILRCNLTKTQAINFAAANPVSRELIIGELSILCERAFRCKKWLERIDRKQRDKVSIGADIDAHTDWNTLRQLLRHTPSTQPFLGLQIVQTKE